MTLNYRCFRATRMLNMRRQQRVARVDDLNQVGKVYFSVKLYIFNFF